MQVATGPRPDVQRHRAAIRRSDFSVPLKCVLRDSLLDRPDTLFDFGCGHGDDLRHLTELGFDCDGWDPVHRPDATRRPADVVNLGYVLNVIEDLQERAQTLRDAWQLCRRLLVVAARISVGDGGEFGAEYGDGVLTRLGTFQKLYTQAELREYLQGVLETEAVPAAPGVFYIFKDGELGQRYFAARYRRRGAAPRQRISERRFEEHRALLESLMAKIAELGRLPSPDEFIESQALITALGSLKRAFALIRRVTGDEEWDRLRQERVDDLTVYLALARFRRRPPISSLPIDLQRDIREFFGSYTRACETADACLFQAGDATAVDQACQRSSVGRLAANALFVHKSAVPALAPVLRIYEGCARAYLGEIDDANVVKLHRFSGKVSYLACPDFDAVPHPAIQRTVKLSLRTRELDCRDQTGDEAPLVLDQKERLVDRDYPQREKFARLTEQEQQHGLLDGMLDLRTRRQWELRLDEAGLQLRGYRLSWKPGAKRQRPASAAQDPSTPSPRYSGERGGERGRRANADVPPGASPSAVPGSPDGSAVRGSPDSAVRRSPDPATLVTSAVHGSPDPAPVVTDRSPESGRSAAGGLGPLERPVPSSLPSRSRRYGVGKEIGGSVYVHRHYEDRLGPTVAIAKRWLPAGHTYDVVKYNRRTETVSFIRCPGFDVQSEPSIGSVVTVRSNGTLQRRAVLRDPLIYHHKWLFVADDYTGFDVAESQARSAAWLALPDVDKSRIGRQSYWQTHVVPRLAPNNPGERGASALTTWHIFLLHFLSSSRTIVSRDGRLPASD